jgi:hypothetical protein
LSASPLNRRPNSAHPSLALIALQLVSDVNPLFKILLIIGWLTGGSISSIDDIPQKDAWESLGSIGLNDSRIPWLGVQHVLQKAEKQYLRSLGYTNPLLVQDFFWITEDDQPHRPTKAVCILFREILLLCRYHTESSLTLFDHTPANLRMVTAQETEKLFVYGYLYPRHISRVNQTATGNFFQ